ncbi:hypothetical protein ASPFODRAFT_41294 [Aspergillus luchuensis CBS 106.47]|uniref:Zn(2)-C6 fungal-type domain-containing protein n=1 Tax=Aspergillus luchuensis (strain CBS 106.47) TaxID=1137211 RepID=A0A1M3TVJ6_ASPLC|nr:hypothetical protein ASPFODRAFT_41294 [Aspergillus luchuensis CBS 106.47]
MSGTGDGAAYNSNPDIATHDSREHRPPVRRRKTRLACNNCRNHKTRCDGRTPACSRCANRGLGQSCIYEKGSLRTQRFSWLCLFSIDYIADTRRYVLTLEDRVRELQRSNQRGSHRRSGGDIYADLTPGRRLDPNSSSNVVDHLVVSTPPPSDRYLDTQILAQQDALPTSQNDFICTDATVIVPSPETDSAYASGTSSVMGLVQSMMRAAGTGNQSNHAPRLDFGQNMESSSGSKRVRRTPGDSHDVDIDLPSLPPRRVADNLMNCFWNSTHPIFPILHKPTFVASYELLWAPDDDQASLPESGATEDPIFLASLNAVFAIGCHFSDIVAPAKRATLADQFYQKSRKFYQVDVLDFASLSTVQMLLLTGLYLQSTKYASRCWNIFGLAIRSAYDIGLHIDSPISASRGPLEREMRRRVWHNCVVIDRLLGLTFGRPSMISKKSSVPAPLMVDDAYLLESGEENQLRQVQCRDGFFIYSIQLFDILDDIISKVYDHNGVTTASNVNGIWGSRQRLEDILKLNSALDDLDASLPSNLGSGCTTEVDRDLRNTGENLQARVFYSRFLYIRILLLRPVLLSAAQNRNTLSECAGNRKNLRLEDSFALDACRLCVSTVHTLIAHLDESLADVSRSPGWRIVHYAFVCAIVLLISRLCPIPGTEFSSSSLEDSVSRCIMILEHHSVQVQSATQAMKVIEALQCRVAAMNESANEGVNSNNLSSQDDNILNLNSPNGFSQFHGDATNLLSETWLAEHVGDMNCWNIF